jgi:predicted nucleotidyltransferase
MSDPFIDLLSRLARAQVRFVLIGGYACIAHGTATSTQDIDICCEFTPDNLLRLQAAVSDLHPVHRMTPRRLPLEITAETSKTFKNLYLDTDLGQLDCVSEVQGLGNFNSIWAQSETVEIAGEQIQVLNLEALIESKKAMNRVKDQEAIRQLESIKNIEKKDS